MVLDEYADFRGNLLDWYAGVKSKGDSTRPPVLAKVGSLGRKGRTARIHLIFGTQRPDQEFFGGVGTSDLRDNLRLRISLGRLSPQGAMMMWNSPAIGTAIPVGCRGRATSINDVNQAVEIQTYRTPDPRRTAVGSEEQQLLHQLRPDVDRHERLLIVPPDAETEDDGTSQEPTYAAFAQARWVRAADRPDLDPVRHRQESRWDGRLLASPLAPLGLVSAVPHPARTPGPPGEMAAVPQPAPSPTTLRLVPEVQDDDNGYEGFAPPELRPVQELAVGDRVLIDESSALWGVLDEEVEHDLSDPGCIAVSWRGDDDECGVLSVPEDQLLSVCRPLELADAL